nr:MAG TPA: hypothetical protein [Caudoviricetes sp.]
MHCSTFIELLIRVVPSLVGYDAMVAPSMLVIMQLSHELA